MRIIDYPRIPLSRVLAYADHVGASEWYKDAVRALWTQGVATGVNPVVLSAQCALETGWGRFGGAVSAEHNNTCGLKTRDADGDEPADHQTFPDLRTGAQAHAHHLMLYCGLDVPSNTPDPRASFVRDSSLFGSVENVVDLSGKWTPDPNYGKSIKDIMKRF